MRNFKCGDYTQRVCVGCQKKKRLEAFVGGRSICRGCWVDIPPEERPKWILNEGALRLRRARLLKAVL